MTANFICNDSANQIGRWNLCPPLSCCSDSFLCSLSLYTMCLVVILLIFFIYRCQNSCWARTEFRLPLMKKVFRFDLKLVYDILPSTTAVFSYAIGSRKLSANEQFFVGAQTEVSLLQTTQIKQGVSFMAANKVYTSTNKTTIVWTRQNSFFHPGWMRLVRALALGCFYSHISTRTFRKTLTASLDNCAEIKSAPSVE